jgi:hypothetical protein
MRGGDTTGSVTAQYFARGQTVMGSNYLYSTDHLQSIREMTNSTGVVAAEYAYDPYDRPVKMQETQASDFRYAGHFIRQAD